MRLTERRIMKKIGLPLKRAYAVLMILIVGMTCISCKMFDSELEQEVSTEEDNLIVVGYSQLGSESVWRTANTNSIEKALSEENGFFLQLKNARQKQENQIKAIRSFISQRVDYIVFSPIEEEGWRTVLTEAREAGIPVILVDRTIAKKDESLYTTRVGTDTYWEGEQAGKWLEQALIDSGEQDDTINIVVLEGTTGATSQIGRSVGFETIASYHTNWNIMATESGDFTTAKGKEVMEKYLWMYDDIDVLVSQNDDMTFGAIEALKESGRYIGPGDDIRIISFDGGRAALERVKSEEIDVDIECNPQQGELLAEVIHKLESGEKVEKVYVVEDKVFTKENVDEYLESRTY